MSWFDTLFTEQTALQAVVVIALICATGMALGKVRLGGISLGQDGYVFAVSAKDYVIEYHPNEDLIGADAIDAGLSAENLEDGTLANMTLAGEPLFCGVTKIGDMYYISAVPEADMAASSAITVGVILFAFFVVIAAVTLYGIFVLRDDERHGHSEEDYRRLGPVRLNRSIAGRALVLVIVGFLGILVISFYMQTLFALSSQSLTLSERAESIAESIERRTSTASAISPRLRSLPTSSTRILSSPRARNSASWQMRCRSSTSSPSTTRAS